MKSKISIYDAAFTKRVEEDRLCSCTSEHSCHITNPEVSAIKCRRVAKAPWAQK